MNGKSKHDVSNFVPHFQANSKQRQLASEEVLTVCQEVDSLANPEGEQQRPDAPRDPTKSPP